jgi:signal transduction histidine kinase
LTAVAADRSVLSAVLHILLSNAQDALPRGGRVTIEASAAAGGGAVIAISDSGRGFKPAALERARAGKPSGRKDRLGLGLPLAVRLLARLGGTITFANARVGARIVVSLPPAAK